MGNSVPNFHLIWKTNLIFQKKKKSGHTPDSVSYYIPNRCIFVGDTIFQPDCGTARCDFPNGSAQMLYKSLNRILSLDDNLTIYIGHDYPKNGRGFEFACTVKKQKEENMHMKTSPTEEEYVKMRNERGNKKENSKEFFLKQFSKKKNRQHIECTWSFVP